MINRRKKREEYLLDVKVQTQSRLRQRARFGAAIVAALLVFMLSCYGMYRLARAAVARLVFENTHFSIAQIVVENDGVIAPQRVVEMAGVHVGQNSFALDLKQTRRNLETLPLVRRVEVRRLLPNRLLIHVDERVAVARLHAPGRDVGDAEFYVDREGWVMKPLRLTDGSVLQPRHAGLGPVPVLTGVRISDVRVGRKVETEQIYLALQLLEQLAQSPAGTMIEAERIDLSKPRQLALTTKQQTVVGFDVERFQQQLRRLAVILTWAQQRQKIVRSVDLTVNRGVPATFAN